VLLNVADIIFLLSAKLCDLLALVSCEKPQLRWSVPEHQQATFYSQRLCI
jgi:hypothetical protein